MENSPLSLAHSEHILPHQLMRRGNKMSFKVFTNGPTELYQKRKIFCIKIHLVLMLFIYFIANDTVFHENNIFNLTYFLLSLLAFLSLQSVCISLSFSFTCGLETGLSQSKNKCKGEI